MPNYYDIINLIIPDVEFHQNRYARALAEVVTSGCRWLDLGAGTRIHQGWKVTEERELASRSRFLIGCDVVAEHLARNIFLTHAAVAEASALPFQDDSFDLVTANMVLEHLSEPRAVIEEVSRVLAPGGHFVFVTPNRRNPAVWLSSQLLSRPLRKRFSHLIEGRESEHIFHTYYRANARPQIERLLKGLPLRAERLEAFSSFPFVRKPWPVTLLESLCIRVIRASFGGELGSNLLGVLQRVPDGLPVRSNARLSELNETWVQSGPA